MISPFATFADNRTRRVRESQDIITQLEAHDFGRDIQFTNLELDARSASRSLDEEIAIYFDTVEEAMEFIAAFIEMLENMQEQNFDELEIDSVYQLDAMGVRDLNSEFHNSVRWFDFTMFAGIGNYLVWYNISYAFNLNFSQQPWSSWISNPRVTNSWTDGVVIGWQWRHNWGSAWTSNGSLIDLEAHGTWQIIVGFGGVIGVPIGIGLPFTWRRTVIH